MRESHISCSPEETATVAAKISRRLTTGDILSLEGALGVGKSVFARALGAALGVQDAMPSPTYAIALDYPGTVPVLHVDLYRLTNEDEFEMLDLDPLIATSLTIVEWADRAPQLLSRARVRVKIDRSVEDDCRHLIMEWRDEAQDAPACD